MRGGGMGTFRVEGEVVNMDVNELLKNEIPNREEHANWLSRITYVRVLISAQGAAAAGRP